VPLEGVLHEAVRVVKAESDFRRLFLGAEREEECEQVVLDGMVLHQLVEEGNLAGLSHRWVRESDKGVESSTKDIALFVDLSEGEFRDYDIFLGSLRVS